MKRSKGSTLIRLGIVLIPTIVGLYYTGLISAKGAIEQGVVLGMMALGIFISFRILNIADLTGDGSFTFGTAVSSILAVNGHPLLGIIVGMIAGATAGVVTALLQTKLKIQPILAGILTMTGLYSINLRVMGRKPNISLYMKKTIFTPFYEFLPNEWVYVIVISFILIVTAALTYIFLKTQLGTALRATGDNEAMVRASSINTDAMKILGLAIANGLIALSGGIMAQFMQVGDINSGTGMMVTGLASIIIGEAILGKGSILRGLIAALMGTIAYRFIIAGALKAEIDAIDFKLLSAVIVVVSISIPALKRLIHTRRERNAHN